MDDKQHFLCGKGHALYAEITEKPRGKIAVDITGNCSLIFIETQRVHPVDARAKRDKYKYNFR
uniref:Uncharacterized protein n=1 Tax=Meloidogyne enterolobii TaxID=390850 RepID=A0A6V7VH23_MELEN|nr:unnamed protein product [Meloidogyne enterolobii]